MKRVAIKTGLTPYFIATFSIMEKIWKIEVCIIKDIKNDLYVLEPIDDPTLTLQVPINSCYWYY